MATCSAPETTVEPLLVRVDEPARILSLSRSRIYALWETGELPSVRCSAARRIPVVVLRAWVERQTGTDIPRQGVLRQPLHLLLSLGLWLPNLPAGAAPVEHLFDSKSRWMYTLPDKEVQDEWATRAW